jgi:hypothetical protein
MRSALPFLLGIAMGACGSQSGGGEESTRRQAAQPTVVRFEYRDAARQLVITARDGAGQVVGVGLEGPIATMADGRCGLGGRRNGQSTRFALPSRRLTQGRYEVTVRLTSSSCGAKPVLREATTRIALTVSSDGSATATDERGRRLS